MSEHLGAARRSHYCGEVDKKLVGGGVTVMGWVNKRRDLGQLIFITLRDRTGVVQAVLDEEKSPRDIFAKAKTIKSEFVVALTGTVRERLPENVNPDMKTGEIEIDVTDVIILNESETPPFSIFDEGVSNDLRLKYRYIDLRRPEVQRNFIMRHKIAKAFRSFLDENGFIDVETPVLTKSSPEGARDYLVPSRLNPGAFYALPQSPQLFKQLLMVAGFDRYYQITKCFRDEDLRADRQPEFTQVDIEMSFVDVDDVIALNERLLQRVFAEAGITVSLPIRRLTYTEAMERFGSDKPDLRFDMELKDLTAIVSGCAFTAFQSAIDAGGSVRGINARNCASFSRKRIDALVDFTKSYKAKGLAWISINPDKTLKTSLSKFFGVDKLAEITAAFGAVPGDLILICADENEVVFDALGALRREIALKTDIIDKKAFELLWVTDFPLFEWSKEDERFYAKHHPFTSPADEDADMSNPSAARAKAYDIVLNGSEIGGGSIRIYRGDIQRKMFATLGISDEEANDKFGYLLEAFKYGAPPHGGIAYGLDRITALLAGGDSIRDVIAFPKVKDASCPLTEAPSAVSSAQLKELGINVVS
ncbi:MAG: aspartate--tRNA ligase [Clostridiales bacterium]|jgi:aspartyl-tRNA synthetase|nr:aspartate--tRNA ligase [Clostridiales bacterium]